MRTLFIALTVVFLAGCSNPSDDIITIDLVPRIPTDSLSVRWSPKGEQLALSADGITELSLAGQTFPVRVARSDGSDYLDLLGIDRDRNGTFEESEMIATEPSESRGKIWSSFTTTLDLEVLNPVDGTPTTAPYPLSFWLVFDPLEPDADRVLRYSRRGWTMAEATIDGVPALIMLTESVMDGVYDDEDAWALAEADSMDVVLGYRASRPANRHAWLGERAYRLVEIDPSGLRVTLRYGDPGITRAEEIAQEDVLAVDRRAPRSGRSVAFEDFEAAEARSKASGAPLFIDFKTVWCGPCYTMDEWVFTADAVVDASNTVVPTRVDGDDRRDLAERFDVVAYPTLLLIGADGTELRRKVGYLGVDSTAIFMTTDR